MNQSLIIMVCNASGMTDPSSTAGWSILDFDWSNAKGIWATQKPMKTEETLLQQTLLTISKYPDTTIWIYRNSIYGYPWYESVQMLLNDPEYSPWFIKFVPGGSKPDHSYYVPTCDDNYDPPLCSDYYHGNQQTPGYPSGDGDCAAPACDVGNVPVGFYVFNHSSTAVIKNQTFLDWFINGYMLNSYGMSNYTSGFFWDDYWSSSGLSPSVDSAPNSTLDMGLTQDQINQLVISYDYNMQVLRNATLAAGKFSWQMLWTGGSPDSIGGTCPSPLVSNETSQCIADLQSLCSPTSPAQTRTMMYAIGPGSCRGDPSIMPQFTQDLANFLLTRGPYAYFGHGWLGCSRTYILPDELNRDYGVPLGLCAETAPNSGIFTRTYTKSLIQMDCYTFTANITML